MTISPQPDIPPAYGRGPQFTLVAVTIVAALLLFWPRGGGNVSRGGTLIDAGGSPVPVTGELAPVTLVHFWATWCPPCVAELPELVEYARATGSPRFRVLFVAVADDPEAATQFLGADDIPLFFDPLWSVARRFGTEQLPETHLVVGGQLQRTFVGATRWSDPAVRRELQKWTATPASAEPKKLVSPKKT